MMKSKLTFSVGIVFIIALVLGNGGCQSQNASAPTATVQSSYGSSPTKVSKEFTLAELAKYDGKGGNPAYIAIDGQVYDVTDVPQWRNGIHGGGFQAGNDYTNELKQAPHGASAMKVVPIVGILVK